MAKRKKNPNYQYRNPEWLKENADAGKCYVQMANDCDVRPKTLVDHMIKNGIYTKVPLDILAAHAAKLDFLEEKFDTECVYDLILSGNPVIKKNSKSFNAKMKMSLPNPNYAAYEEYNLAYLDKTFSGGTIDFPVLFVCFFYKDSKRATDISNLYEAPQDVLVRAGVLQDDNSSIIIGHDGSRVRYDKQYPRTEIFILKATNLMLDEDL